MKVHRHPGACFFLLLAIALTISSAQASAFQPPAPKRVQETVKFDLQQFVDERIAAGERHIVIPSGRHLLTPKNRQHLLLKDLKGIVIDATGAEMVCTEATRAISITNCENLTLRGLVIDYDPLPFTQARIVAVSPDKLRVDFEIIAGYSDLPAPAFTSKVEIFDPATNFLRQGRTLYEAKVQATKPGRGSFERTQGQSADATEQIGDIVVIDLHEIPEGNLPHVIYASESRGLVFENITVFSSPSFSFLEVDCEGSRYVGCRVDRRPPELDYTVRGHARMRSSNADAFHSKQARRGPRYERCSAYFMGDDAIAINGDFHIITGGEGVDLRVIAKNSMNMLVGDRVQLLTRDGVRLENRRIVALNPAGSTTEEDREVISALKLVKKVANHGMKSAFIVTLDAPITVSPGSYICSADAIANGFAVENCDVGHNRSRGILVKAGGGRIANNHVVGSAMTAIMISPEPGWLEGGFADGLVIENNTASDCGGISIAVYSGINAMEFSPAGAFHDITVRNNTVTGGPAPGLLLTSIRGLVDENNTIITDPAKKLARWQTMPWGKGAPADSILINID